jgi:hypothetical protein
MSNQDIQWVCVFKTNRRFEAEAVKGNLESEEIPCILLNKQDSTYMAFGYVELHVPIEFKKAAEMILLSQDFNPSEN